jgi:hypothetical protein
VGDVAGMIRLSQRTMANIRQNITIALGLKAAFLVTTIAGITGLWPAILADTAPRFSSPSMLCGCSEPSLVWQEPSDEDAHLQAARRSSTGSPAAFHSG